MRSSLYFCCCWRLHRLFHDHRSYRGDCWPSIVKDSDIERDLRVTYFLDGAPLDLGTESRKKATKRLIDQVFIRREIRLGDYPAATPEEAGQQLDSLKKQRFKTNAAYQDALRRYGLTEADLRTEFQWQLTVLRFIDARFKPAVLITAMQIERYYREHRRRWSVNTPVRLPSKTSRRRFVTPSRGKGEPAIFFLAHEQRQGVKIQFREASLRLKTRNKILIGVAALHGHS